MGGRSDDGLRAGRQALGCLTMPKKIEAPGQRIYQAWLKWSGRPGGKWLFSKFVGRTAPYTGTINARVEELRPGYARLTMQDRAGVRQHLGSVHAVALINLAEETTGLAMLSALGPGVRGIVVHLEMDYLKKARGLLTCECECSPPRELTAPMDFEIVGRIRDEAGDEVARAMARWKLSPP